MRLTHLEARILMLLATIENRVVVGLPVFYWIKGKGATTLTITTLSTTTLSIRGFYVPLSISDSQRK
jgi:hypothetical protein